MGKIIELTTQIWEIGEQIIKENDDFRRKIKYLAQNKIGTTFLTVAEKESPLYLKLKKTCEELLKELNN